MPVAAFDHLVDRSKFFRNLFYYFGIDRTALESRGFFTEARAIGLSLKDMRAAGFSLTEAKAAGYSLKDMRDSGVIFKTAVTVAADMQHLFDAAKSGDVNGVTAALLSGGVDIDACDDTIVS